MIRPSTQSTTMFFHHLLEAEGLNFSKDKILECLYLADRMSLLEIGRTITKDMYIVKNGKIVLPECNKTLDKISEHFDKVKKSISYKRPLNKTTIESYLEHAKEDYETYEAFLKLHKDFDSALKHLSDSDVEFMIKALAKIKENDFNIYDFPEFKNCGSQITPKDIVLKSDLDTEMKSGILDGLFECQQIEAFFEDWDSEKKNKMPERD